MAELQFTSEITVHPIQQAGGDHMVVAAAKVSTCGEDAVKFAGSANAGSNAGLIGYLMRNRHGTPFEHSLLTFFVHAPWFVWWEWVRHRIGHSFNLESGRYSELKPVFWVPRPDRKLIPAPDHKSARPSFVEADPSVYGVLLDAAKESHGRCYGTYRELLGYGIAKEVARTVLPNAIYYAGWVTVNPRSLMAFLSLRTHEPTAAFPSRPQAEIEEAARACELIFAEGWPITYKAFVDNGRVSP